ncbi:hypothetical protein Btru_054433 [Bulinus truncatus]|nr:hypothetical protein Btru_054433 [Bulinus truncatus]
MTSHPTQEAWRVTKWRWIVHSLRKPPEVITKMALRWNTQGQRKACCRKTTWRRSYKQEMKSCNMGRIEKDLSKQSVLERDCRGSLLHKGVLEIKSS